MSNGLSRQEAEALLLGGSPATPPRIEPERGGFSKEFLDIGLKGLTKEQATKLLTSEKHIPPYTPYKRHPYGAVIGGTGMGLLASRLGPTAAVPLGILGSMGGEAIQQVVERGMELPVPKTGEQAARQILREGGTMGAADIGGRGILRFGRFLPSLVKQAPTPAAQQAMLWGKAQGLSQPLLPHEATSNRLLDFFSNVVEHGLGGMNRIANYKELFRQPVLDRVENQLIDTFGQRVTNDEAARILVQSVKGGFESARVPAKMIYGLLESAASPKITRVPTRMVVKKTEPMVTKDVMGRMTVQRAEEPITAETIDRMIVKGLEEPLTGMRVTTSWKDIPMGTQLTRLKGTVGMHQIPIGTQLHRLKVMTAWDELLTGGPRIDLRPLKESIASMVGVAKIAGGLEDRAMGKTLLEFIAEKPDLVSYPVAKQIRTEVRTLSTMLQQSIEAKNAPAIAKATDIYSQLTESIRAGLRQYDPFLSQQWDKANLIERTAQTQFNNKLIRSMMPKAIEEFRYNPEALTRAIQALGPSGIQKWRQAVDPSSWRAFQSATVQSLFNKSISKTTNDIDGRLLLNNLVGKGELQLGRDKALAIFDPMMVKRIEDFGNFLAVTQSKTGGKEGTVWIQLKQAQAVGTAGAAIAGFATGHAVLGTAGAAAILLTPAALSYVFTHPKLSQWFMTAVKHRAGSDYAMQLLSRVIAALPPRIIQEESGTARISPSPQTRPPHAFAVQP